jgi:hypothetical protein
MRLTYETGIATLAQFIVLGLINIAGALESIISTCRHNGNSCVSNLLVSVIFYLLLVTWFGIVAAIGVLAQNSRNRKLAILLILAEFAVFCVAGYNVKLNLTYHNSLLGLITSLLDIAFSLWVISLAYRLIRSGGRRVVKRQRRRKSHVSL